MAFERHDARRRRQDPRRIATINGRPAWQVVKERNEMVAAGITGPRGSNRDG